MNTVSFILDKSLSQSGRERKEKEAKMMLMEESDMLSTPQNVLFQARDK